MNSFIFTFADNPTVLLLKVSEMALKKRVLFEEFKFLRPYIIFKSFERLASTLIL